VRKVGFYSSGSNSLQSRTLQLGVFFASRLLFSGQPESTRTFAALDWLAIAGFDQLVVLSFLAMLPPARSTREKRKVSEAP